MITRNRPDGFLPVTEKQKEGEEKLCYDISSRLSLERLYEKKDMGFEEIRRFFVSWQEANLSAERYLLTSSFLICDPKYIYMDPSGLKTEWICYPKEEETPYPEDLKLLAEFILEKANREDSKAAEAAYAFYKAVKEDSFLLPDLLKMFEKMAEKTEEDLEPEGPVKAECPREENETPEQIWERKPKESLFVRIGRFVEEKLLKRGTHRLKVEKTEQPRENVRRKEEAADSFAWMSQQEESGETVLLAGESEEVRELYSMSDGRRFCLDPLPVTIGKLKKEVDLYLDSPGISRYHARILEADNAIWVEDTNSKNGVVVNEYRLSAFEKVKLTPGDRIYFGREGFIFR